MNCFVYIDLNSPTNDPSLSPLNPTSHLSSSKETSTQPKSKGTKNTSSNSKKLTRSQHFTEVSPLKKDPEEKPLTKKVKKETRNEKKELQTMEIEKKKEKTPEKTPEGPSKRLTRGGEKSTAKGKHDQHSGKKMPSLEKLSLDEYIKQIEKDLNLSEFHNKTETYQKDLNLLEENINDNKFLEEMKDEPTEPLSKPIIQNIKEPIESQNKLLESIVEKPTKVQKEDLIVQEKETKSSSVLLQETIQEMKKLKKQQHQKTLASVHPDPSVFQETNQMLVDDGETNFFINLNDEENPKEKLRKKSEESQGDLFVINLQSDEDNDDVKPLKKAPKSPGIATRTRTMEIERTIETNRTQQKKKHVIAHQSKELAVKSAPRTKIQVRSDKKPPTKEASHEKINAIIAEKQVIDEVSNKDIAINLTIQPDLQESTEELKEYTQEEGRKETQQKEIHHKITENENNQELELKISIEIPLNSPMEMPSKTYEIPEKPIDNQEEKPLEPLQKPIETSKKTKELLGEQTVIEEPRQSPQKPKEHQEKQKESTQKQKESPQKQNESPQNQFIQSQEILQKDQEISIPLQISEIVDKKSLEAGPEKEKKEIKPNELCEKALENVPKAAENKVFIEPEHLSEPQLQKKPTPKKETINEKISNEHQDENLKKSIILIDSMEIEEEIVKDSLIGGENGEAKSNFTLNPDRPKLYRDIMTIFSETKMDL